jgi:hypothetical protein
MTAEGAERMANEEDRDDWMDDYEASEIVVSDLDLLTALDRLDRIDPQAHLEDWYKRLSGRLDRHLKPKLSPTEH